MHACVRVRVRVHVRVRVCACACACACALHLQVSGDMNVRVVPIDFAQKQYLHNASPRTGAQRAAKRRRLRQASHSATALAAGVDGGHGVNSVRNGDGGAGAGAGRGGGRGAGGGAGGGAKLTRSRSAAALHDMHGQSARSGAQVAPRARPLRASEHGIMRGAPAVDVAHAGTAHDASSSPRCQAISVAVPF